MSLSNHVLARTLTFSRATIIYLIIKEKKSFYFQFSIFGLKLTYTKYMVELFWANNLLLCVLTFRHGNV